MKRVVFYHSCKKLDLHKSGYLGARRCPFCWADLEHEKRVFAEKEIEKLSAQLDKFFQEAREKGWMK